MAIQTQTFKKRVLRSELSPVARYVALVIADLRYEARLHAHEPLLITHSSLAQLTGLTRRTVQRRIDECKAAGWLRSEEVFRDGRQHGNHYWIQDPLSVTVTPSTERHRYAQSAHQSRTVVRSNNSRAADAAPQRAEASDEQDKRAEPATIAAGAAAEAAPPAAPDDDAGWYGDDPRDREHLAAQAAAGADLVRAALRSLPPPPPSPPDPTEAARAKALADLAALIEGRTA
jgi:DNA-binding transcriptional MocR family regulator